MVSFPPFHLTSLQIGLITVITACVAALTWMQIQNRRDAREIDEAAAADEARRALPKRVPGATLRTDAAALPEPSQRDVEDLLTGAIRLLRASAEQAR